MKFIPTYDQSLELTQIIGSPFYESKLIIDGFQISLFNYRLSQWSDFNSPGANELRGISFVFNLDGTLYKRFLLLEKFFNLNQVPDTMYDIVKNYKIKSISNKEDGSIASFIKLPNGKVVGKSKMGFNNEQANGINRIYRTRTDVKTFVDWSLNNDITSIFEYVSPDNRIVLRYLDEELILLRMRDNTTGKHLDIKNYLDKIGTIRIAPFEDVNKDLDSLIEVIAKEVDKEGVIVQSEDKWGKDFFFKLKTPWYMSLQGLLTDDIYREHIIIGYILDDKIDDILGQIPEDEKEAHLRINKIIQIVKKAINDKSFEIKKAYKDYIKSGISRKDYAINQRKDNPNFAFVMGMVNGDDMRKMSEEQIIDHYYSMEAYEKSLKRCETYEMAKEWLRDLTKRLTISREWLKTKDKTLFFQEPDEENEDN